jgi:hypothetical protein
MKYSNIIGVAAIALLFMACNMVWITVPGEAIEVRGFRSRGFSEFGRPGIFHLCMMIPALLLFLTNELWAKRVNVFVTALNMAWGLRNMVLIGMTCKGGICPERQPGIYLMALGCVAMFIMSIFPRLQVRTKS